MDKKTKQNNEIPEIINDQILKINETTIQKKTESEYCKPKHFLFTLQTFNVLK